MTQYPLSDRLFDDADRALIEPFALFEEWLARASQSEPNDPNAMAVATVDADGLPDVRTVLLNGRDARGFVFFTNFESAKGQQLAANPRAALLFHWKSVRRQVRIRGTVTEVAREEADAYFASRPRGSQIASSSSAQSRPVASKQALLAHVKALEAQLGDGPVPRPEHWSGFRVAPTEIEFWQDGAYRLHDRVRFTRASLDAPWHRHRLYP